MLRSAEVKPFRSTDLFGLSWSNGSLSLSLFLPIPSFRAGSLSTLSTRRFLLQGRLRFDLEYNTTSL
jgi:hypothetical protein